MDFSLTKEQKAICNAVKDMCLAEFNHDMVEHDDKAVFDTKGWQICSELGLCGLPVPEEYGGQGQNMMTTALAIQTLGRHCPDEGLVFSLCAHLCTCAVPLWKFGTQQQKIDYLTPLASGRYIGGNAMTESEAGSDSTSIRTEAIKFDTTFRINGSKMFVTNGPLADVLIIYASHPGGLKMANISAFLVEKNNPGVFQGQMFNKMGLRTSPMSEILLKACVVDTSALLGRERFGMRVFNESMIWERIIMSAFHVGAMERQYKTILEYADSRKQFGRKISGFSAVSDKLVDMKLRVETSKLMLYHVCWKYDGGQAGLSDASMIKLLSSEAKVSNSLDAVQVSGAYGYMKENPAEKQLRDSIAARIYSGTSEIQKKIIAENL